MNKKDYTYFTRKVLYNRAITTTLWSFTIPYVITINGKIDANILTILVVTAAITKYLTNELAHLNVNGEWVIKYSLIIDIMITLTLLVMIFTNVLESNIAIVNMLTTTLVMGLINMRLEYQRRLEDTYYKTYSDKTWLHNIRRLSVRFITLGSIFASIMTMLMVNVIGVELKNIMLVVLVLLPINSAIMLKHFNYIKERK